MHFAIFVEFVKLLAMIILLFLQKFSKNDLRTSAPPLPNPTPTKILIHPTPHFQDPPHPFYSPPQGGDMSIIPLWGGFINQFMPPPDPHLYLQLEFDLHNKVPYFIVFRKDYGSSLALFTLSLALLVLYLLYIY